ncbi:MAG: hypothetical protein H6648_05095 [Caldilineae bacterium]|nr:hypothetical protein [Caldilineae bacterium]
MSRRILPKTLLAGLLLSGTLAIGAMPAVGAETRLEAFAELPEAGPALHVRIAGDLAFVPAHARGTHIVDISEPARPRLLATAPTAGAAYEAAVLGDRLYVAAWSAGLEVFDIGDPAAPRLLGSAPTRANAQAVAVLSERYVVTGDWSAQAFDAGDPDYGLLIFDVSDPATPRPVGRLDTPGWAGELAVVGHRILVADAPGGLRIVDATDPTAPVELGALATELRAYGLAVDPSGRRVLIADNLGGLIVADLSDPRAPRRLGRLETGLAAYAVALSPSGEQAWLAEAAGGGPQDPGMVRLIDLRDPSAPTELARIETRQRAWGVALDDAGQAWVAATGSGLLGLRARAVDPSPRPIWLPWLSRP